MEKVTENITNNMEPENSQILLTSILNSTSDMIWSVNPVDFGLLMFNRGLYDYFRDKRGISIKAGMRPEDLFPTDEFVQIWRGFYQRAIKEGSYTTEYSTICGTETLLLSINVLKQGSEVISLSVFGKNISVRKQTEEALRETEDKFKYVFDHSVVGKSITLPSGEINVNKAFCEMLGYSQEELQNKRWQDITHSDDIEITQREINALLSGEKEVARFTKRYLRKDKSVVWTDASTSLRLDQDGHPLYFMTTLVDITERKQFEEKLIKSEERYRLAQQAADIGSWEWDMLADTLYWSDEMCIIFDKDSAKFTPTNTFVMDCIVPEDKLKAAKAVEESLTKGKPFDVEYRIQDSRGKIKWLHSKGKVVWDNKNQPVLAAGTMQDITERKRAEEVLEQSREQLRALTAYWQNAIEAERTHIARELHDDFGQLMTALKMDLTWLAKRLPEGDDRVERIHGMNTLVDASITLMRRIASSLRPGLLDDLGLNAALKWQTDGFQKRTGIVCDLSLPPDDLDQALNTTLFRIFQEALTNIARHAQATRVKVSLKQTGNTLILTIHDNGRGIMESETKDPRSLGLLGLRERTAQWGGETTIRGIAGKGTTVTVRIPLPASPAEGGRR